MEQPQLPHVANLVGSMARLDAVRDRRREHRQRRAMYVEVVTRSDPSLCSPV